MSQSIPLSTLYLAGVQVFQSRAAALAAFPNLPAYDPNQAPKYWALPADPTADPDGPFTIHNLHDANGSAVYGTSFILNSQVPVLNIPPDPTSATNAPVYPASVAIPMVYPLPAGDSDIDTPFGIILSYSTPVAAPAPTPTGTDPTIARILANSQQAVTLLKGTPV